ncbi:MAG: Holliday junction branch migration protein RuvA [Candidatus Sericytochromatia bacterium]
MIAFLAGTLAFCGRETVIIDVQGVGYEVRISERLHSRLQSEVGNALQLTTHLLAREDGMELFGFESPHEKEIFLQLTRVSGVGPRTALAVLSTLSLEELLRAIVGNQPKVLAQAPGIGLKTAQRIILELKEKLSKIQEASDSSLLPSSSLPAEWHDEISLTLLALGYTPLELDRAIHDCQISLSEQKNVDEVIRLLLAHLSTVSPQD